MHPYLSRGWQHYWYTKLRKHIASTLHTVSDADQITMATFTQTVATFKQGRQHLQAAAITLYDNSVNTTAVVTSTFIQRPQHFRIKVIALTNSDSKMSKIAVAA